VERVKRYYAIRIDTGTTITNTDIGLENGVFTFVTERIPKSRTIYNSRSNADYSGNTYSQFLLKNGLNDTTQQIDIIDGGEYSNLNSFNFTIINKALNGNPYITELEGISDLYIIGSSIKYFICKIGSSYDTWYPQWTGVVEDVGVINLNNVRFSCIDKYMVHKATIPKTVIGTSNFPDAPSDNIGKNVPVVLGNYKYAQPITTQLKYDILTEISGNPLNRVVPALSWTNNAGVVTFPEIGYNGVNDKRISSKNQYYSLSDGWFTRYYVDNHFPDLNFYYPRAQNERFGNQFTNGFSWGVFLPIINITSDTLYSLVHGNAYLQFVFGSNGSLEVDKTASWYKIFLIREIEEGVGANRTKKGLMLYIDEVPSFLIDRTQFYDQVWFKENITNAGQVGEDGVYVNIATVSYQKTVSEKSVESISENIAINEYFDLPDGNIYGVTSSKSGNDIPVPINIYDFDNNLSYPHYNLRFNDFTNTSFVSKILFRPKAGVYQNNSIEYITGYESGYGAFLNNSLNSDVDTFDIIPIGKDASAINEYTDEVQYLNDWKFFDCNINLIFKKGIVDKEDYDTYSLLMNMKQADPITGKHYGTDPAYPPFAPITTSTDKNFSAFGNWAQDSYDFRLRAPITFSENHLENWYDTYSAPYNDEANTNLLSGYIEEYSEADSDWFTYGGHNYTRHLRRMTNMIPNDIIPCKINYLDDNKNIGYNYVYPHQVLFEANSEFSSGNSDYNTWDTIVKSLNYSTKESLSFDSDLIDVYSNDNEFILTATLTPTSWNGTNFEPTWDVLKLYNIGILLEKTVNLENDIYFKTKGEILGFNKTATLTMSGSDSSQWDGDYVLVSENLYRNSGTPNTEIGILSEQGGYATWVANVQGGNISTIAYGIVVKSGDMPVGTWYAVGSSTKSPLVTTNQNQTDNLYDAIRHIVDAYSDIDRVNYGNLFLTRRDWNIGTQINTQKNSLGFLMDVCRKSFVAGWTDSDGVVCFDAFRDRLAEDDTLVYHNDDIIIDGSIKEYKRTPLARVNNEIEIKYDYNGINGLYNSIYAVRNVKEDSFPLSTEDYSGYIQGIDSYSMAKGLWEIAHNSYLETRVSNKTPSNRTELNFVNDLGNFYDNPNYDKTEEYAYKYFKNTLDWNTRQKRKVTYELPINDETVNLDIMQRVRFQSKLCTGSMALAGWVTSKTLSARDDKFIITITAELINSRLDNNCGEIVERNTNIDEIIEETANTDEIIEGC